jgi:pimeloyl-ACP methyl ester carboxylesterase
LTSIRDAVPPLDLERWQWTSESGLEVSGWRSPNAGQNKPVLVFLHGNGFAQKIYSPLLSLLSVEFDLYLPEAPNHGEALQTSRFIGWNATAKLYAEHLDKVSGGWSDWYLSGHSFGGVVSILLANYVIRKPRMMVLLDPIILPRPLVWMARLQRAFKLTRFHPMVSITRNRRRKFSSYQEAYEYFDGRGAFKGWTRAALSSYVIHSLTSDDSGGLTLVTPPKAECDIYSSFAWGLRRHIGALSVPCRILLGRSTFSYQQRAIKKVVKKHKATSLEMVEGGHCFMQQFPEDTASRLLSFVKNNENEV